MAEFKVLSKQRTHRLVFLDSLRGLAAFAVMVHHFGCDNWAGFKEFVDTYFELGQFGVSLFFLCSGFVIPYSIERSKNLKAFWISRFFRLYPLYWLVTLVAVASWYAGIAKLNDPFTSQLPASIFANLTMVQGFFGFGHAVGSYWSLGFEMVFYGLTSILFVLGLQSRTQTILGLLLALCLLNPVLTTFLLHSRPHLGTTFHVTTMVFGTLVYRWHTAAITTRRLVAWFATFLISIVAINFIGFYEFKTSVQDGVFHFLPMTTAWLAAYSVFAFFFRFKDHNWLSFAKRLGTISFSIYLWHGLVICFDPQFGSPLATFVGWIAITYVISEFSYKFVEEPFIALGKKLSHRKPPVAENQVW